MKKRIEPVENISIGIGKIPNKPEGYAKGIFPLTPTFPIVQFVQFRIHDYKSCGISETCFCRQTKEQKEIFDQFLKESFCCKINDFKRIWHNSVSNQDSNTFKDSNHPDRGKYPLEHIKLSSKYRIHGYYTGNVFHIVSIDPDHAVHKCKGR
ncbi:MAG6450 family protein [Methanimicrococcus stummii]|nr:hypothetical protein [Methanimicrococcus sp. Es2]